MTCRLSSFLALSLLVLAPLCRAADDDPVIAGKKASEWLELLDKSQTARNGREAVWLVGGPLMEMLEKPGMIKQRRACIIAMGIAGPKTTGAGAGLSKGLRQDKDAEGRREAATTIRNMGTEAIDAMEYLAEALKEDKDEVVRMVSATALGRMAEKARPSVPILAAALKDKHAGTRSAAAEALGQFRADAR